MAKADFARADSDHSGLLDEKEMRVLLSSQGKSHSETEDVIRRWFSSSVFREIKGEEDVKGGRGKGGAMSRQDYEVYLLLQNNISNGLDESVMSGWLTKVLDASGDGSVSVKEFRDALPEALKAANMGEKEIKKLFKIIARQETETGSAEEVEVSRILVWLERFKRAQAEKSEEGGEEGEEGGGEFVRASGKISSSKGEDKEM